jgi:hypothetical protein
MNIFNGRSLTRVIAAILCFQYSFPYFLYLHSTISSASLCYITSMGKCIKKKASGASVYASYTEKQTSRGIKIKRKDAPPTSSPSRSTPSKVRRIDPSVIMDSPPIPGLEIPTTKKVNWNLINGTCDVDLINQLNSLKMISQENGSDVVLNSSMPSLKVKGLPQTVHALIARPERALGDVSAVSALACSVTIASG